MPDQIVIAEYDPSWPLLFEKEKASILAVAGDYIDDIQHIGSTSVPGLGAKPVIDILISLRDLSLVEKCVPPLHSLDYEYFGEHGLPGRHFFRKPPTSVSSFERTHHILMVQKGHEQWTLPLLFRDYLRLHPEAAQEYYLLKKALASQYGADREGYTNAKTEFVQSIIRAAA